MMRSAFSAALIELANNDPSVILLTGDHGYALFDKFRQTYEGQYLNAGIAEQNMVGMAAGLAKTGFKPIVYGLSAFIPIRTLEQIKLDVAHENLSVVFIGDGAGFAYSHLGSSHQSTEDIACTRCIPNLRVLSPGDSHEMTACMYSAFNTPGPSYIRMGKSDLGEAHASALQPDQLGTLIQLRQGKPASLGLIATGSMLRCGQTLAEDLDVSLWSMPQIKPINSKQLLRATAQCSAIVTLEEHSIYGGMGSTVAETLSQDNNKPILRIGVQDRFSKYCGSYEYLLREHGLDIETIRGQILQFQRNINKKLALVT